MLKPESSFALSKMIWQIPLASLPRRERAILRALADHHPNIWPSVERLGAEPGYSRAHTAAALRRLEADDWITVKERFASNGKRQSSTYVINVAKVVQLISQQLKKSDSLQKLAADSPEIGG
jgi:hypothetical protein